MLVLGGVLTISDLVAVFSAVLADLPTTLDSNFLFVTDAFNGADTGFAAVFAGDLAVVFSTASAALVSADFVALTFSGVGFAVALVTGIGLLNAIVVAGATFAIFLTLDLLAAAGFATALAATLEGPVLAGTCFAIFAEDIWDFAGFFIAFAMGSTAKMGNSTN